MTLRAGLRRWFLQPPRPHGEVIEDRTVSFLELFYDLVYVVLVAQIAHTLAEHVSWSGVLDFAVVFGLIWIGWFNGTQFHELHGRQDGRNRSFIFLQMGILTVLAVFAAHATTTDGEQFALTYAALLSVLVWQWASVYRTDAAQYRPGALRYLAGLVVSIGAVLASSGMGHSGRLAVWAAVVVGSIALVVVYMLRTPDDSLGIRATASMAERYGLFIIIVLGEVVFGVVDGLRAVEDLDFRTVATGVLGLCIAFGFWWTYFDYVGRRLPRQDGGSLVLWLYSQLPIALAVGAAGAGMVSLIEHAADARTPEPSSWLLAGSVAALLIALAATIAVLADYRRLAGLYRPLTAALLLGAAAALAVGWARPAPWLLATLLDLILVAIWSFAFARTLRTTVVAPEPG
ncbi:MAG: low temperature requirement protein A [Thermoleophilaceae bacterium]|nr:low temperature requirement protein A [Thermoleophilaceae bacterium]